MKGLEEEILNWIGDEDSCKNGKWTWQECNKMIRYFYELGLKMSNERAELFFIDKLKELPIGNGKYKLKAECSLEEFITDFHKAIKGE